MKLLFGAAASLLAAATCLPAAEARPSYHNETHSVQAVCQRLQAAYPNATYVSPVVQYNSVNKDYWTPTAALGPACIFEPARAHQLSHGLRIIKRAQIPFAVKGGGHMPIAGFNNINSTGVLVSTGGFRRIAFSKNKKSLHFGPGNHWQDVYKFTESSGLVVVGGRVGIVGIPGYYLGGGVSFMGNQYGWASNSLVRLEVVLASGHVVNVTKHNQYSDLLWAMKGGANSFAIITDIEAELHPASGTSVGYALYGNTDAVKAKWQDAIVQLAHTGNADPRHGVIPVAISINGGVPAYTCFKFHNGNNETNPPILANFSAPNFPPVTDSFAPKSMYRYTQEPPAVEGQKAFNQRFYALSLPADASALAIAQTIAFKEAGLALGGGNTSFSIFSFTAMPMPTSFFAAAKARGGDPQGIDPDRDGPQVWLELSHGYAPTKGGEAAIDAYLRDLDCKLRDALAANGTPAKRFIYLNDADRFQDVFAGYPPENLARLRRIRRRYDPERLLTEKLVGGFKVDPRP